MTSDTAVVQMRTGARLLSTEERDSQLDHHSRTMKHFWAVKKELEAAGVKPAFDPKKIGATFYRREQVDGSP